MYKPKRKISLPEMLLDSNLEWWLHKHANPKAANRRSVVINYIKRNLKSFDHQAKVVATNLSKTSVHNQMKAYDLWFYVVYDEKPTPEATQPSKEILAELKKHTVEVI